jgi:hypothetical protein
VRRAALAALLGLLLLAPAAAAQTLGSAATTAPKDPNAVVAPKRMDVPPQGYRLTGLQVQAVALKVPKVAAVRARNKRSAVSVFTKGPGRWQVSVYRTPKKTKEIAQVLVDDRSGKVTEANTGFKVAWTMARGYPGAFGRKVNSPLVWIPLTVLFLAPFLVPRRASKLLLLDLAVLVAFGISVAFFNDAQIDVSVPLVYPLLVYLLLRMLWVGLRRPAPGAERRPLALLVPASWLAVAVIFLLGFRIGLNVTNSNVIDVGYAGVIGADRLVDGYHLYGAFPQDNPHGDTYGPVLYAAYIPFEQALPWSGRWDDLPAAHAAAIFFDLLCVVLLFLLGRRVRGPTLGIVLAYAWVANPFTLYVLSTNSNDALVAVAVLFAMLVAGSPPARGAAAALGGLTKFATLALTPLLMTHGAKRGDRLASMAVFSLVFAGVVLLAWAPLAAHGDDLATMYDQTIAFQAHRGSPFSIWGLYDLTSAQHVWQALAVLFAVVLAFVPRRPDVIGLAACAAAVLIAAQMGLTHWFYLYIVWFLPLVLVALLGRYAEPVSPATEPSAAAAPQPAAVPAHSG